MHEHGLGVEQDLVAVYPWYSLAAGGEDDLRNDPLSPLQVGEVMVEDDEMANFTNLLLLLMETP
ncbi:MAG: SEL1-like repeat protein [Planctomycetota bacterium]